MFAGRKQQLQPLGVGQLDDTSSCYQHQLTNDCRWCSQLTLAAAAARSCDVQEDDALSDAESCCGDPLGHATSRLEELEGADVRTAQRRQGNLQEAAQQQQQQERWQQQQHWLHQRQQQQHSSSHGGCSSDGHSSGGCWGMGAARMGDDFECMASEDVSMLLEDTAEYPGGVEAALADWAGACSSQLQEASFSAGAAPEPFLLQQQQQQQAVQHAHHQQQMHGFANAGESLPMPPTPLRGLASSLLPCCQWGSGDADPVADVLAGKAPVPTTSCCSSGGLTDCVMGSWE